jgi:hypothetical protein
MTQESVNVSPAVAGAANEQNLAGMDPAVVVMVARSNHIDDLRPLMPKVRDAQGANLTRQWTPTPKCGVAYRHGVRIRI